MIDLPEASLGKPPLHESCSDCGETRTKILTAARLVFAENGFSGARVDDIARRAGVNKASLYYHIGDKEALYAEILRDALEGLGNRVQEAVDAEVAPEAKLRAYVRAFAAAMEDRPQMGPILIQEIASGAKHFPDVAARGFSRILGIITGILEEGRQWGVFHPVIPFIVHLQIVGTLLLYRASAAVRSTQPHIPAAIKKMDMTLTRPVVDEVEGMILRSVLANTGPKV